MKISDVFLSLIASVGFNTEYFSIGRINEDAYTKGKRCIETIQLISRRTFFETYYVSEEGAILNIRRFFDEKDLYLFLIDFLIESDELREGVRSSFLEKIKEI